jgi:hypothetical protein
MSATREDNGGEWCKACERYFTDAHTHDPVSADEALLEDIEWATGMNGKTLVEQLAELGLVIRVR